MTIGVMEVVSAVGGTSDSSSSSSGGTIISDLLKSGSSSGSDAKESGMVSGGIGTNILGDAVGDPIGFIFNQIQYAQQEDYQKEQDAIKNKYINEQTRALQIANKDAEQKMARQKKIRNLMMGYEA